MIPLYVGSEIYRNSSYGPKHPLAVPRVSVCTDLCRALGWLPDSVYREAPMATEAELIRFHDPSLSSPRCARPRRTRRSATRSAPAFASAPRAIRYIGRYIAARRFPPAG